MYIYIYMLMVNVMLKVMLMLMLKMGVFLVYHVISVTYVQSRAFFV